MDPAEKTFSVQPQEEFRFEVSHDASATLTLHNGIAEIYGVEVCANVPYSFSGCKLALFSWDGCTVTTTGMDVAYVGKETSMPSILNLFFGINTPGKRVLVVGQADSGKSTLCRTLANWAGKLCVAERGDSCLLVDLDSNHGSISLPGTLAALPVSRPLNAQDDFSSYSSLLKTSPISYYYGEYSPLQNERLYKTLLSQLAINVNLKLSTDESVKDKNEDNIKEENTKDEKAEKVLNANIGPVIIDTPSQFAEPAGFEMLEEAIEKFKANVIVIIGHERLYSDLSQKYSDSITILKLPKSGGDYTRKMHLQSIRHYFYGSTQSELFPFSQTVSFADVAIRRIGEGTHVPSSALPIGHERKPQDLKFIKVECGDILLHSVLAVSHALLPGQHGSEIKIYTPEQESDLILKSSIAGFVYISEVDAEKRRMTVLSPTPGKLPKTFLIMGALKWLDG